MLQREFVHHYAGFSDRGADKFSYCYVRIYAPTVASEGLPVVIVSDAPDSEGTSTTNLIEQIAAEVLLQYLPEQDGLVPPFWLIDHYPDRQPSGPGARYHQDFYKEEFSIVTFDSWVVRVQWTGMQ